MYVMKIIFYLQKTCTLKGYTNFYIKFIFLCIQIVLYFNCDSMVLKNDT